MNPAWSPDGQHIAFQSFRDGNWEIYVMRADGSAQSRVTNTPTRREGEPSWSPDGTRLVFSAGPDDNQRDLYVMGADGADERRLTRLDRPLWGPRFSPDGARIAFFEFPPGDIYVMNAGGSGVRPLFAPPGIASISATPKRPAAGRVFTLVLRIDGPSEGGRVACSASARGRALRLVARALASGVARCGWRVPVQARGARLAASVTVTTENGTVTRDFAAIVR